MHLRPEVGCAGGQEYPVLRSIQTFLNQMAEGGARAAPTVLKELLQNADDAGATEMHILLDERRPIADMPPQFACLVGPALLIRNNAPFRLKGEGAGDLDDFSAIRDVASGHKRAQATAAGRFGIGFNSVYFLTDTPLLFSRREVHAFDLLGAAFPPNGWRFSLDEFPADASSKAGPLKNVLAWSFPKAALHDAAFADVALVSERDYGQAAFRLPFRTSAPEVEAIFADRFRTEDERASVLRDMIEEGRRSVLFLRHVVRLTFGVLRDSGVEPRAAVESSPAPPEFGTFLKEVRAFDEQPGASRRIDCAYNRTVTLQTFRNGRPEARRDWPFRLVHVVRYDNGPLGELRARLKRNGERAVPWGTLAIPLNSDACTFDGDGPAKWRVVLPLLEDGPSACMFSGSLFVGPSRGRLEYRLNESDEGSRRTQWNQAIVESILVPALRDVSLDLPELAPALLNDNPREYLALFPKADIGATDCPASLSQHMSRTFGSDVWRVRVADVWGVPFDVWVGDDAGLLVLESVPDWLFAYRDRFRHLSTPGRRFIRRRLGDALADRLGKPAGVKLLRTPAQDALLAVLLHELPPSVEDITELLRAVVRETNGAPPLEGAWAFATPDEGPPLRYRAATVYVIEDRGHEAAALRAFRALGLAFEGVEWVGANAGVPQLLEKIQPGVRNVLRPNEEAALELLRRFPAVNSHDRLKSAHALVPFVDFLVERTDLRIPPDARLGFLVTTANGKAGRRRPGVILLRPTSGDRLDDDIWELWFKRHFAEVDPVFAREVARLRQARPDVLSLLHASDCRVFDGTADEAHGILHVARTNAPDLYEQLRTDLNTATREDAALRISTWLLGRAADHWERLTQEERCTVLALPIHRRSDGVYVPLVAASGGDPSTVRARFRVQSEKDLEDTFDAPVDVGTHQLLQSSSAPVQRFYRVTLGLEAHGRVAVLKDVLRQIGNPVADNARLLRYLRSYYSETLRLLRSRGTEADEIDSRELARLFAEARSVPCLDGEWRRATDCGAAWRVVETLARQLWASAEIPKLIRLLFGDSNVADMAPELADDVRALHGLTEFDSSELAGRAVSSGSPELALAWRARVIRDNRPELLERLPHRAPVLAVAPIAALSGTVPLGQAELFSDTSGMPAAVVAALAPTAVDVRKAADELGLGRDCVTTVLEVLGVPRRTSQDLVDRFVSRFAETWQAAASEDRLEILKWIDARGLAGQLRPAAAGLDTVLDSSPTQQWRPAAEMLAPLVTRERPPLLPPSRLPGPNESGSAAGRVWNEWCGVRTFEAALDVVLQAATGAKVRRAEVAADLYAWLGRVSDSHGLDEVATHLRSRQWLLAQHGDEVEFRSPVDVLDHPAAAVLRSQFWVLASSLPEWARRASKRLGIRQRPEATTISLGQIAKCLADPGSPDDDAALSAYALTVELVEQSDSLHREWLVISSKSAVFRAFRSDDRRLASHELFLGDAEFGEDLSSSLLCLKDGKSRWRGVIEHYRRLGVAPRPTLQHLLHALSNLAATEHGARAAHRRLVQAVQSVPLMSDSVGEIAASVPQLRVLTCAGTYAPVSMCLWDPEVGRKGRVEIATGGQLVDTADRASERLVAWIGERGIDVRRPLRAVCDVEVAEFSAATGAEAGHDALLWPWREWAKDLAREGSTPRDVLARHELPLPGTAIRFVPVHVLRVRFRLEDGQVIEQSPDWEGPLAVAAAPGDRVLVRVGASRTSTQSESALASLDASIAREVALLFGGRAAVAHLELTANEIVKSIERPSTVLARLHATNLVHALHQYHDQVADPEFSELFDTYARTVRSSPQAEQLRSRMETLLRQRFVGGRRELIRGYGYDERSVFAELIQNAEDAYAQCCALGIATPDPCDVTFRYVRGDDGTRVLEFEHRGRIFNDWQRGPKREPSFARDVEGVLRSAGSFKTHQAQGVGDRRPHTAIGRFGLGFKSVYLLTDRPEIHSGPWNFVIEAGCLPVEIPRPADLPQDSTRIRLPLRLDAATDRNVSHLTDLVPFVRRISRLTLQSAGESVARVDVTTTAVASGDDFDVQRVTLRGAVRGGEVTLVRCRSHLHEGQLAIVVGSDGLPRRWDEIFEWDLFATLPLRARLGCGVGASHRFEVQSGRTHLVDPKANQRPCREVASLLPGIVVGVSEANGAVPPGEVLAHFWSLWRWDRGDEECGDLRADLAKALADLAQTHSVVPTLDPARPTSLGKGVVFAFVEIPGVLRDAIIDEGLSLRSTPAVKVAASNVVADGFAVAFRRACAHAGVCAPDSLVNVGWAEIAAESRASHWLADHPRLVSVLARALNEEQRRREAAWISLCSVRVDAGGGRVLARPGDLLAPQFPGRQLLPARLLKVLHGSYDEAAVELLTAAGLRPRPQSQDIRAWVCASNLTRDECLSILRYLDGDDRFHTYAELRSLFRSQWFAGGSRRLTTNEAVEAGLVPKDVISSDVFRTWLGLSGETEPTVQAPVARPIDPEKVLSRLHDWWSEHGAREVQKYEARVYPGGRCPTIDVEFDTRNRAQRRAWLSLFLLGALHTMGRVQPEQHRQFLVLCESKGWLDVFADNEQDPEAWMGVLDEYIDSPTGDEGYLQWMKQFVSIYRIARALPEYVECFLNVNRMPQSFGIDAVLNPRAYPGYSGGGLEPPPVLRTLGIGASFVLRELVRFGRIAQPLAHRHCYVPAQRVRSLLVAIGCTDMVTASTGDYSSTIHRFLVQHMGEERATFGLAFDLPLLTLAENDELQQRLSGGPLETDRAPDAGGDDGWRTAADGHRYNLYW